VGRHAAPPRPAMDARKILAELYEERQRIDDFR
jgi:hypothetical protein